MASIIPNSGKQVQLRNNRTGSVWLGSYNYINQRYHFQPVGNVKAVRREFESMHIPKEFELAGTH
ncbi:hypothetical protein [Mixta intestinalis]|uniref:Uncharacterized protein n=1 Tax=Mixta intestinalis TaxID=1615494 RepID=A0A6P1PX15_9GAMM|nr:hypothetical protein [Mixta intestinalis]QHM70681.1 hypothetical protein C7M51_00959 [Mixta intestinalis]